MNASTADDITMDEPLPFPPRKKTKAQTWEEKRLANPPKQRTPEEMRAMVARAREIGPLLAEKLDALNDAFVRLQDRFVKGVGESARGRVVLYRNVDGYIEHLLFRDGQLWYESGFPGEVVASPLLKASKRVRMLAASKVKELWEACGGPPV